MSVDIQVNGHSRLRKLTGVQVLATGSYVPDKVVTNEDLLPLGFDPNWIVQRTGIRARRHAPPGMSTSDLAAFAGRQCIERSGVNPLDIDLLLLGTLSPDHLLPATACTVQNLLGLKC